MDYVYEPQEAIITEEKWIDAYKIMSNDDKVKHMKATEEKFLIDVFKYISQNKNKNEANEIFGNIKEKFLENILNALNPSQHIYFYACLDSDGAKYACKHYQKFDGNLMKEVMNKSVLDGIEDEKMMWRFVKDFADNSRCKEWIIENLVWITESALNVMVNGVDTKPGLITVEFLKSILEKESDRMKKHKIIDKVMKLLGYFRSDDVVKDVVSAITDMQGLENALKKIKNPVQLARVLNGITHKELLTRKTKELVILIQEKEYCLLEYVLNVIGNKDIARAVVQECAVNIKSYKALAQTANNVKDKEIVYYMMEVLKKNGMLMNEEIFSFIGYDAASVVIYGVPDASDKPRLVGNEDAAKILGYFTSHEAAEILSREYESVSVAVSVSVADILKCIGEQHIDAAIIENMLKDISLARSLNEIGADDIEELKRVFDYSERGMTLMLFKHLDDKVASVMIEFFFNGKKSFLIGLSGLMAVSIHKPTKAYLQYMQEIIYKVWRLYGVGGVSDLLLDMSDDEIKKVLSQLGHKHEINALIYVGTKKNYENAEQKKNDVRRIFDAIENKRRNRLLNDISTKESWLHHGISIFTELMDVLKEASVEYKEIADMLLRVEHNRQVKDMICLISKWHGNVYLANIFLSIDNDGLRSMISNINYSPALIARILGVADDIDKLSRLLNIIESSGISNENMKIVLDQLVINAKIVNELIDKPEDEQNEILGEIDNTQPAVVGKIKCAINKEVRRKDEKARSILRTISNKVVDEYRNVLDNISDILTTRDLIVLKKCKADIEAGIYMLKMLIDLIVIKESAYSDALNMNRVVEKQDIIGRIETINAMISGIEQRVNDIDILIHKDSLKSMNEKLHEMVLGIDILKINNYDKKNMDELLNIMNKMMSDAEGLKGRCKELYDQVAILCNEIKNNIQIYLMEKIGMFDMVNLIILEINEIVRFKNKRSDQSTSVDEVLNGMTPDEWKTIVYTVVKIITKTKIYTHYDYYESGDIEVKEMISKESSRLGVLINNSKSNLLSSEALKKINKKNALMLSILFILVSIFKNLINHRIVMATIALVPTNSVELDNLKMLVNDMQ